MFLKRIELKGFKSFADKSVITFDSDVIGIVGPNGCGKSNINDAIRWVLGEQSVKSLRGNNMSDVIFSGSTQRKAVNTAEVTLVFDNTKKFLNVEYEEVEITRRLHRNSGEGEYFINRTPCRLKDILNLVMDSGLGRDSLSIISQGNISAFAEAKPEERRALFEEAAGVAKYKKRKNESLAKLQRTQDNLLRVEDIILELERQVNPLKRQAKKAETYLAKKEELEAIEVSVIVDEIERLMQQIEELKKRCFDLDTQCAMHETTIQVEDVKNNGLRKEMFQLDHEINKLQEEYTQIINEISILETRKVELDEKRKYALEHASNQEKAKELKVMVEEAHYEYQDRYQRLQGLKQDIVLKKQMIQEVEHRYALCNNENQQEAALLNRLQNRKEVLENVIKQPFQHQQGVKAVMENQTVLFGVLGVVSSLLKAQMNYEDAISNALGGAMYHIVTEDEASARHAISFLKKNQSGRATFLPLTVLKPRQIQAQHRTIAENTEGFLGSANEFVLCDERFHQVKDALLGNVLLCDTLLHANELAKRLHFTYKIITLDGDVVHKGGSMSGGRTKTSSPMTIQKELNQILQSMEGQKMKVDSLKEQLFALQEKRQNHHDEMVQLQISLAQLEPIAAAKQAKWERLKAEYEQIAPKDETWEESSNMEDDLVVRLSALYSKRDENLAQTKQKRERRMKAGSEVERKETWIRQLRREMHALQNEEREASESKIKAETRLENALERLSSAYEMTYEYAATQKKDLNIEEAKLQVSQLRREIASLGNVNLDAPAEYQQVQERFDFLTKQKEDLLAAKNKILTAIDEMDEVMIKQFKEMFERINAQLDETFKALFGGGKASMFMVDPEDILNTGIDINVQPPGKTVQNIRLFSGGEKALIAICVLFSILKARTMPLCIFDEVEAALDQANVERFAKYIGHFRGESQFIVVTHRPGTMAQCDALYGVTMQQSGVSQLLKVQLQDAISLVEKNKEGVQG